MSVPFSLSSAGIGVRADGKRGGQYPNVQVQAGDKRVGPEREAKGSGVVRSRAMVLSDQGCGETGQVREAGREGERSSAGVSLGAVQKTQTKDADSTWNLYRSAAFTVRVRKTDGSRRAVVKSVLEEQWDAEKRRRLDVAAAYYRSFASS